MRVFSPGEDRKGADDEILLGLDNPEYAERFGDEYAGAKGDVELLREAAPLFDEAAFLAGRQTPMFFGSAINNFGVREVLDALVDLAPPPGERAAIQRVVEPDEKKFSGVVFKIQANMDPAHRDRIAFVRVASGHFERGMRLKVVRSGKELRPEHGREPFSRSAASCSTRRTPGDIIGIPEPRRAAARRHAHRRRGAAVHRACRSSRPRCLRSVEVADPLRTKQLRAGLTQLGEGRRDPGVPSGRGLCVLLLGAVGQLPVRGRRAPARARVRRGRRGSCRLRFQVARWVTYDPADGGERELQRFIDANQHRVAYDAVDAPTVLVEVRARAARDRGQLAEDQVPRLARARGAGVPEAARGAEAMAVVGWSRALAVVAVVALLVSTADAARAQGAPARHDCRRHRSRARASTARSCSAAFRIAAPPVGDLRWHAPEPAAPWDRRAPRRRLRRRLPTGPRGLARPGRRSGPDIPRTA